MSEEKPALIRDFIYVDQDRLYSFYSQLNKGVAQQIFQSVIHGESAVSSQMNPELKDETSESQRNRSLQRTENTILYDYMYEQLEAKLGNAILDVSKILPGKTLEDLCAEDLQFYFNSISSALLVKVSGSVELEDYGSMDIFLANSHGLMRTFAHLMSLSTENVAAVNTLKEELEKEKDRNKKAQIKESIRKLQSPDIIAKDLGLLGDPELIKDLRFLLEFFYNKHFHIAISITEPLFAAYRAIINRNWLRIDAEILRSLYPGIVESNWTMVGQVTSKCTQGLDTFQALIPFLQKHMVNAKSLRDPMRFLFTHVRSLEAVLNQNGLRFEPIVFPLAIYRELKLTDGTTVLTSN